MKLKLDFSLLLVALLLFISLDISFWTGGLSYDSGLYLTIAQKFNKFTGLFGSDPYAIKVNSYFTTWPLGYPFLISIFSLGGVIPVFWASKLVSWAFLLLLILTIRKYEKVYNFNNAKYFRIAILLFFLFPLVIVNLSLSLTDIPFALISLVAVFQLAIFFKQPSAVNMLIVVALSFGVFLLKYNGIYFNAVLFSCVLYAIQFDKQLVKKYIIILVSNIGLAALYLSINYHFTGTFTGIDRAPSLYSFSNLGLEVLSNLARTFVVGIPEQSGIAYAMGAFVLMATVAILLSNLLIFFKKARTENHFLLLLLTINAMVYLVWIMFILLVSQADPMGPRYLFPITISFVMILFLEGNTIFEKYNLFVFLQRFHKLVNTVGLVMVLLIVMVSFPTVRLLLKHRQNIVPYYKENAFSVTENNLLQKMEVIPNGSVVGLLSPLSLYLRPDLQTIYPKFAPLYVKKETLEAYLERVKKLANNKPVYFYTRYKNPSELYSGKYRAILDKSTTDYIPLDSLEVQ